MWKFVPVGYSWTWKGGGPSVFTNESFDANMYLFNNPDLQRLQKDPVQHYARISETEKLFRTSQFKVYDSEKTWKRILDVNFDDKTKLDYANTYYGTFFYWNNAPRRNYTNQQYWNYPHMLDKVDSAAFQEHLQSMKKKMETRTLPNPSFFPLFQPKFRAPIPKDQFLFLTAWNEWNEQSVLEPNDIDGYDALMAVKYVFKSFPSRTVSELILHIGHRGGGTEKYIGDLMQLFSEYRHIYLGSHELNTSVGMLYKFPHVRVDNDSTILIHVHSAMVGSKAIRWQILHTLSQLCRKGSTKNQGNLCYMTVHDYQWLFPSNPNPNLEFLATFKPQQPNINNCRRLFSMMDRIIYPSRFVRNYYFYVLFEGNPVSLGKILQAIQSDWNFAMMKPLLIGAKESQNTLHEIVGHNDLLQSHNYLNIPGIIESEINIAFVGNFHRLKGSDTFSWLARNLQEIAVHGMKYTLQYHIFGREMEQADCESIGCRKLLSPSDVKSNIIHHGEYTDNKLETLMQQSRIHLVTMLSTFPETWCYALSPILNMGLPLVYFNHGSFLDRIPGFLHQDNPMKVDDRSLEQAQLHREDFEAFYIESKLTKYFPIEMTENGYTYDENILLYKMNEAITFAIKHTNKTYGFQRQSKQIQPRKWYILNYPKPMDEN